jgi:hypothetical protein
MKGHIVALFIFLVLSSALNGQWRKMTLYDTGDWANYLFTSDNWYPEYSEGGLKSERKYSPENLFDSNLKTAWVDGEKGRAHDESIFVLLPETPRTISIFAGYAKSRALFEKNNRPKTLELTLFTAFETGNTEITAVFETTPAGISQTVSLEDTFSMQRLPLPFSTEDLEKIKSAARKSFSEKFSGEKAEYWKNMAGGKVSLIMKIKVKDYYRGGKWDDTCISEIHFNDIFIPDPYPEPERVITDIYTNEDENEVLIDTKEKKKISIIKSREDIYQLLENSADNHWAVFTFMPAEPPPGRMETQYIIVNTMLGRDVTGDIKAAAGTELYDFSFGYKYPERKEGLFLEYYPPGGGDRSEKIFLKK